MLRVIVLENCTSAHMPGRTSHRQTGLPACVLILVFLSTFRISMLVVVTPLGRLAVYDTVIEPTLASRGFVDTFSILALFMHIALPQRNISPRGSIPLFILCTSLLYRFRHNHYIPRGVKCFPGMLQKCPQAPKSRRLRLPAAFYCFHSFFVVILLRRIVTPIITHITAAMPSMPRPI
jgi:hypothetical protein